MRRFLPSGVGTQFAKMRDDLRRAAKRSIGLDAEDGDRATRVIRRQQMLSARMNRDMGRLSTRGHGVEESTRAAIAIDAECGCTAGAGLVSGIKELLGRVQNNE